MFKPNVKKQVELKFVELFGKDHKPTVTGGRITQEECRKRGIRCLTRDGIYRTALTVDGEVLTSSDHREWRAAYKGLIREVEKLYADGLSLV
jgi:hypothetical protein